jgi:hypothetical protein
VVKGQHPTSGALFAASQPARLPLVGFEMQGRRLGQPPKGNLTVSNKYDIILTYKRVRFQVGVSETFAWIFTSPGDFVFIGHLGTCLKKHF